MKSKISLTIQEITTYKEGVKGNKAWTLSNLKVKEYERGKGYKTFLDLRPYIGKQTTFVADSEKRGEWTNYTIIGVAKDKEVDSGLLALERRVSDLEDRVEKLENNEPELA